MMPELFRIPGLNTPLYSYGLMLVLGFYLALQLARFLARRSGIDPELFVTAGMIALISGLIGARLSHVLENLGQYTDPNRSAWANFVDAVNFRSGGLTFYGGMILATVCGVLYGLYKKAPVRRGMDIVAPCLMVGLAFGRVGCFMNGCCHGAECEVPWAVSYPYGSNAYVEEFEAGRRDAPAELLVRGADGELHLRDRQSVAADPKLAQIARGERSHRVHPSQLYSFFNALLIAGVCLAFYTIPHAPGQVFALMMVLKGVTRYVLEMLRTEPPVVHIMGYGLSFSMVISVGLVAAGIILWVAWGRSGERWPAPDLLAEKPGAPATTPT